MNPNRKWIALAFIAFAVVGWVLITKFLATVMGWFSLDGFDFHLIGDQFRLTTLLGLLIATTTGIYCYRHPTVSTLSNEVVVELKKVTWPTAKETRAATVVVIVTVFIMSFFLGLFDFFWSNVMDFIYPSVHSG